LTDHLEWRFFPM